jgi:hypothetical protein
MGTRQDRTDSRLTVAFVAAAVAMTVVVRLVPYWFHLSPDDNYFWHVMPVGALGLFAGARLRGRWAFLVPVLAMLVADVLLIKPLADRGFHAFSWGSPVIYGSFVLYALLGRLARRVGWPWSICGATVLGTLQFFLITNFLVWLGDDGTLYAHTIAGLMKCYTAGLPFLRNTAAGDLLYTALFFGLHAALVLLVERQKASQPA